MPDLARIGQIAALSVALGFAVQLVVLAAKLAAGAYAPGVLVAIDVASGVAWSVVVCVGTAIGVSLFRAQAALAGVAAAVFAPLGVAAAKAANQSMSAAIGVIGKQAAVPLVAIAGLKAVEYAILGFILATLARRGAALIRPYLFTGLGVGVVFAAAALALRLTAATASTAEIASLAVNETLFPIGCAAVVYVGQMIGRARR